jgi:malate dehydrogenase (oxaloacetate-decarboxylating)(NADP+)
MIHAAAQALSESLTSEERARNLLYPDVERIREVSIIIAHGVIRSAQKLGVDRHEALRSKTDEELTRYIRDQMYHPLISQ